jgi:hypothetical protein
MPLTMNTASRRRNAVLCQGCHRLAGGGGAGEVVGAVAVAGAALGAGARVQASQTLRSGREQLSILNRIHPPNRRPGRSVVRKPTTGFAILFSLWR